MKVTICGDYKDFVNSLLVGEDQIDLMKTLEKWMIEKFCLN